jgi:hypothetical protein
MTVYSQSPVRWGSVSMVTATLGGNDPEVGTRITEGGKDYVFVYNAGTTEITIGKGAVVANSSTAGYSCTVTSVAGADIPLGACYHTTLTTATYGWLLTRGIGLAKAAASTAPAAGSPLTLGADGVWNVKSYVTVPLAIEGNVYGKALVATASAGVGSTYFSIY